MTPSNNRDIKALWSAQDLEAYSMTVYDVRSKAAAFESTVRWRNGREYLVSVFVIAGFSWYAWIFSTPLMRLGSLLIVAATLFVCWSLHKRGSSVPTATQLSFAEYVSSYRDQLVRQQAALRTVWRWYLAPFVPGMLVFLLGRQLEQPPGRWAPMAFTVVLVVVTFVGIWLLNLWAARRLVRHIDEMNMLLKSLDLVPRPDRLSTGAA